MDASFGTQEWVELFREIGLDEERMRRWHAAFERRDPRAHQSFLEWLSVSPEEIERIRQSSRSAWRGV